MDTALIVLGVIGVGAIVTAVYVFTVAARRYVSDDGVGVRTPVLINRNHSDRRSGKPVTFPLMANGALIPHDRRHVPDRRRGWVIGKR